MLFFTQVLQQGGLLLVETMTLLIADSSEEFCNSLIDALQGNYRIQTCRTGKEALMLPELDGLTLLQVLADSGIRPTVLATTRLANDYVIATSTKLGVEYLMVKPCDIRAIAKRVRDLSCQKPRPRLSAPDPKTHVSNLLISLGVSTKLRGYAYLREAVLLMIQNPMQSITKELYPGVAKQFSSTPTQVERSIRNAIQHAWERRNEEQWLQVFQPDKAGKIARPSNAAFISRLADRLLLDQLQLTMP